MTRIPIDDDNSTQSGFEADAGDAASAQMPDEELEAPRAARPPGAVRPADGTGDVERLQAERDAMYDRLARATADFKNTQRRLETEMDQRLQYANGALIKSLLPVIDNFERALAVDLAKADVGSILKGMQIVHDQWMKVLRDQKVEEIAPQLGEPFDPTRHEALLQQDAPQYAGGQGPVVTQVLQKGYALHDRTLRPAQVAVSRTS